MRTANKDDTVLGYFNKLNSDVSDSLYEWKKKLSDFEKMYFCVPPNKRSYDGFANLYEPEFFKAVEVIAANLYLILFADDPFFLVYGRHSDTKGQNKKIQNLLEYDFQQISFNARFMEILRNLLIYENVILRPYWDFEIRTKETVDALGSPVLQTEPSKDHPNFDILDPRDCFFNPSVAMEDAKFFYYRKRISFSDLKRMEKDDVLFDVDRVKSNTKGKSSEIDNMKEISYKDLGFKLANLNKGDYELYDYFGKMPNWWKSVGTEHDDEGQEEFDGRFMVCNNELVKRPSDNPYKDKFLPFIVCPLLSINSKPTGTGISRILEKPQYEINDSKNQILDHKTFTIFQMMLKKRTAGIKRSQCKAVPRNIIDCDDTEGLKVIPINPAAFSEAQVTVQTLKEEFRQVSAPSTIQGIPLAGRRTAQEIQTIYGEGSTRIKFMAINIGERLLKPLLNIFHKLNVQFMDRETSLRITDEQGEVEYQPVSPLDLIGDFDFVPKVVTDTANRIYIKESLQNFLAMIGQVGGGDVVPPRAIYNLIKKIYDYYGFKDGATMFPPWEDIKAQAMEEQAVESQITNPAIINPETTNQGTL